MIDLGIDRRQLRLLERELGTDLPKRLRREVRIAIAATAKKTQTTINRLIRTELVIKSKDLKKAIKITRKATEQRLSAEVTLEKEKRLPIKVFSPRQVRRGTSYRISKSQGRKTAAGAFMGPRPGQISSKLRGNVYVRRGENRKPIGMLHGPSPWGVFLEKRMRGPTGRETRKELRKQVSRRIRFIHLKRTGAI